MCELLSSVCVADCSDVLGMTEQMLIAKISLSPFLLLRSVYSFHLSLSLQLSHTICVFLPLSIPPQPLPFHLLSVSLTFFIHCLLSQLFPSSHVYTSLPPCSAYLPLIFYLLPSLFFSIIYLF